MTVGGDCEAEDVVWVWELDVVILVSHLKDMVDRKLFTFEAPRIRRSSDSSLESSFRPRPGSSKKPHERFIVSCSKEDFLGRIRSCGLA